MRFAERLSLPPSEERLIRSNLLKRVAAPLLRGSAWCRLLLLTIFDQNHVNILVKNT
jgi:hypothetical protein